MGILNSLIIVVHFSNSFSSVFHKNAYETYCLSSSRACQEKRTGWILRIFYGWQSSRSSPISDKTIWHIPNIKNSEVKLKINARFFQTNCCFSFSFFQQCLTYILRPIPLPPLSMFFASIWDSVLAQASMLLLCQYVATLSRGRGSDLYLQSRPFYNFHKSFQELTWTLTICVIYCQKNWGS